MTDKLITIYVAAFAKDGTIIGKMQERRKPYSLGSSGDNEKLVIMADLRHKLRDKLMNKNPRMGKIAYFEFVDSRRPGLKM